MCEPTTIGLVLAAAGTAATVYQGEQARSAQNKAGDQAKAAAATTAQQSEEATNRANAKSPDTAAAMAAALMSGKGGNGSTMLTGAGGIDPSKLLLGKQTLLGG